MLYWRLGIEGEYRTADGRHVQFGLFGGEDGVVRHFSSAELEGMIGRGEESGEAAFAEYEDET